MQVPDEVVWGAVSAAVAWLIKHEVQLVMRPKLTVLERLLEKTFKQVEERLGEIRRKTDMNAEQTQLHRTSVAESLSEIRTNVAVLAERGRLKSERDDRN